jgi:hypothetical protein
VTCLPLSASCEANTAIGVRTLLRRFAASYRGLCHGWPESECFFGAASRRTNAVSRLPREKGAALVAAFVAFVAFVVRLAGRVYCCVVGPN